MKWKQFFTPVESISWPEAEAMLRERGPGSTVLLDVRQPNEYAAAHLPGTTLVPLGELDKRLDELDRNKAIIIY